ncbi:SpaA isopeptide-forming pilin-related protein [Lysinibacter sp. HNR]|uniref:DUF7927 domain-containing protein n=1 Tax=Lysinibacter sp. HNR TaxID=3031408 RepID=UPI002434C990|nr:SpaA isopeptide-forming pilin-related protein [Lysinibacter sp. HNR]WGD36949.1 SpaA isopeptide-forming pilin-related protein [Lysinibacter sp. HNR]
MPLLWRNRARQTVASIACVGMLAFVLPATATANNVVGENEIEAVATAVNPTYPMGRPQGYVSVLPSSRWIVEDDRLSMSAEMPGRLPGSVTLSGPEGERTIGRQGLGPELVTWMGKTSDGYGLALAAGLEPVGYTLIPAPDRSDSLLHCMDDTINEGERRECVIHQTTLTFDEPQINPVIVFGQSGGPILSQSGGQGCVVGWSDLIFESINGKVPASGQVTVLDAQTGPPITVAGGPKADIVFDGLRMSWRTLPDRPEDPNLCSDSAGQYNGQVVFAVDGLVSEINFGVPHMGEITQTITNPGVRTMRNYGVTAFGFGLPGADLSVVKRAPSQVRAGAELLWNVTVANSSTSSDSHGVVVRDAVPAEVTDVRLIDAPEGCVLIGHDVSCTLVADGYTLSDTDDPTYVRLDGPDDVSAVPAALKAGESFSFQISGRVPVSATGVITNTATVAGADADPQTNNNTSTTRTTILAPAWSINKAVTVNGQEPVDGRVAPGDILTYTVTASAGTVAVNGVTITDDLSEVLQSASFVPGSAGLRIGNGSVQTVSDPVDAILTTQPFSLARSQQATLTYQVTVNDDAWLKTLINTVTGDASEGLPNCVTCSTISETGARVLIQKNGVDASGGVVPVTGASFRILADDQGRPGNPVNNHTVVPVADQTGRYEVPLGLMPGNYWIEETRAPAGHELLARPAPFQITDTGELVLLNLADNPSLVVQDGVLTIFDVVAVTLPYTGATASLWGPAGAVVLALSLVLTLAYRLRQRRRRSLR